MITAVDAQALASTTNADRARRPESEPLFKQLDSGNKGYLTVDDLQAAVVRISAQGARRADAAAPAAPGAQDILARLDGDGDGKVTRQEFKAAEPKGAATGGGGAAPAGAQAPAGGAAASSTQVDEPADTNEDGKVSALEQQAYEAKLAAEKAAAATASGRSSGAVAAVKAYEAVEQLGQAGA